MISLESRNRSAMLAGERWWAGTPDDSIRFYCKDCHRWHDVPYTDEERCPVCGWKPRDDYQDRWGVWHTGGEKEELASQVKEERLSEADRAMLSRVAGGKP